LPKEEARLEYTIANAQQGLHRMEGGMTSWSWEQPLMEEIIRRNRKALDSEGVQNLTKIEIQRTYTNLGNSLSNNGRWLEAFQNWRQAIDIDASFHRAKGQIGISLLSYARHVPDLSERVVLFQAAHDYLGDALMMGDLHPNMEAHFRQNLNWLTSSVNSFILHMDLDLTDESIGVSEEQEYRKWCLQNRLFLSVLNDVSTESNAAKDSLHLPKVSKSDNQELISCIGFLNQIKQEYVSARYLLWKGINGTPGHFSDRRVKKRNVFDYTHGTKNIELIKSAYKTSYSIFDKIALLISNYFGLDYIERHRLHFDNVWYKSRGKNKLAPNFQNRENWPLRGLFWLSKDLEFDSDLTVQKSLEPGAEDLRNLRNELEHGHVRVFTEFSKGSEFSNRNDRLSRDIYLNDFERKAIDILKKARASIIYTILGLHYEETH
jgi:hypothetical protein